MTRVTAPVWLRARQLLHAQAADAREAGRRALIESGARREVLMMVPVDFLILPVTVLFACRRSPAR